MPRSLLEWGLIAPGDRPLPASATCRLLSMAQELTLWCVAFRIGRRRSALVGWIERNPVEMGWFGRHRRAINAAFLASLAAIIGLDASGYGFTARRLSAAGGQSLAPAGALLGGLLADRPRDRPPRLAMGPARRTGREQAERAEAGEPDDLADRLRRLAGWGTADRGDGRGRLGLGLQHRTLPDAGRGPRLGPRRGGGITVGDLTEASAVLLLTAVAWRHLADLFALLDLPQDARGPGGPLRRPDALPIPRAGRRDARRAVGRPPRPQGDRRGAGGPGRRAGLRPPGDRLELRQRDHPAAGAADPRRRRGDGLEPVGDGSSGSTSARPRSSTATTRASSSPTGPSSPATSSTGRTRTRSSAPRSP